MKRCPECRRDYYDDKLWYCLNGGDILVQGIALGEMKAAWQRPL
jgi:hypothetical protein